MTTGYNGTLKVGPHVYTKYKFPKIKYPKLRCRECGRFLAFLDATLLVKDFLCKKCSRGTK